MKLSYRCLSAIGLLGATIFGGISIATAPVQAIPEALVIDKLQNVPVYVITDESGTLVEAQTNTPGKPPQTSTGVFLSSQDAQNFIDKNLKTRQPDLTKVVKVTPVSLGEIYRRQQENKNKPQQLSYVLVPTAQQASSAISILNRSGQKLTQFNNVPVFIAMIKVPSGQEEYLMFRRDRREIVPLFLSEPTLRAMVAKTYPNLASKVNIRVIDINSLFEYMTTKNDPIINNFEFNANMDIR
ncbi:Tic22 family protein [Chamaesiphon sp.]|uniref:Tic22 family protein n=1 Tax=Chamaesiphon sp. TaxID=2814140 RepID=UPI003593648A